MSQRVDPEKLLIKVAELERRLETMERTSRLTNASLKNGVVRVYDAAGTLRVYVGKLPNGLYGIRTYNASGVQTAETSG